MKVVNTRGYPEISILDNCDFDQIEKYRVILTHKFGAVFKDVLNDFDTVYWDFTLNDCDLTLHYNVYLGLSIYPKRMNSASDQENEMIEILNERLKNWA